jgi:hypothetical protein
MTHVKDDLLMALQVLRDQIDALETMIRREFGDAPEPDAPVRRSRSEGAAMSAAADAEDVSTRPVRASR